MGLPACSPTNTLCTVATCSCPEHAAARCASWIKRSSGGTIFRATSVPSTVSCARYTTPIPPRPICRTITNRPPSSVSPGLKAPPAEGAGDGMRTFAVWVFSSPDCGPLKWSRSMASLRSESSSAALSIRAFPSASERRLASMRIASTRCQSSGVRGRGGGVRWPGDMSRGWRSGRHYTRSKPMQFRRLLSLEGTRTCSLLSFRDPPVDALLELT